MAGFSNMSPYNQDLMEEFMATTSETLESIEVHLNHNLESTKLLIELGLIDNGINFPVHQGFMVY